MRLYIRRLVKVAPLKYKKGDVLKPDLATFTWGHTWTADARIEIRRCLHATGRYSVIQRVPGSDPYQTTMDGSFLDKHWSLA